MNRWKRLKLYSKLLDWPDVVERLRLVNHNAARGTPVADEKVLHNATFANWKKTRRCQTQPVLVLIDIYIYFSSDKNGLSQVLFINVPFKQFLKGRLVIPLTCVEALGDGGGIDEESAAKSTVDVWVELVEGEFGLNKGWKHEINIILTASRKI